MASLVFQNINLPAAGNYRLKCRTEGQRQSQPQYEAKQGLTFIRRSSSAASVIRQTRSSADNRVFVDVAVMRSKSERVRSAYSGVLVCYRRNDFSNYDRQLHRPPPPPRIDKLKKYDLLTRIVATSAY